MKILFVISNMGIGGEQRVASILTKAFSEKNQVDLLVFSSKSQKCFDLDSKVRAKYCNIQDGEKNSKLKKYQAVKKQLREKYDIVIAFAVIPSVICCAAAIGTGTPVIVCERNDPAVYGNGCKVLRRLVYPFAKGAVFQTTDAMNYFPYLKNKLRWVIPNPLNIETLPPVYIGERKKRIVNTARLTDVKNQLLLIRAFEIISNNHSDYSLCIYGDGPKKECLQNYIDSHGLSDVVELHPAVPDVVMHIYKDEIFVLTSKNEGFPNSLVEAMALGLVCISSDCRIGGPRDMLKGKERGILVPVDDINALACALNSLIENGDLREKFSKNAIKIREELDSSVIVKRWLQVLDSVTRK